MTTPDYSMLSTVASLIGGFGITTFLFRIGREIQVKELDATKPTWLTLADLLVAVATIISLLLVVVPCIFATSIPWIPIPDLIKIRVPTAACVSSSILITPYIPVVISHYWGSHFGRKPNDGGNGEQTCVARIFEVGVTLLTFMIAIPVFFWIVLSNQ